MGTFPYSGIADYQNWRRAVSAVDSHHVDPQVGARFKLDRNTKISSAGSCFARNIAQSLREHGFNYYLAEPPPPWLSEAQHAEHGYGLYSARFGEIYSTLQLLQLIQRALGEFEPSERSWEGTEGILDPFRPTIQPRGFHSEKEMEADRALHLAAVARMFAEIDIFIFTLGLTEVWCNRNDGAAYPTCPGRGIGSFDPAKYEFRNLTLAENVEYVGRFLEILRRVNPRACVIFSVSPVPLAATFEERHVLSATTYSKSVLRVAADEIRRAYSNVDYFASYEIVTATGNNAEYFQPDRRNVSPIAVEHVMRSFFANFSNEEKAQVDGIVQREEPGEVDVSVKPCDEDLLLAYINRDFDESARRGDV